MDSGILVARRELWCEMGEEGGVGRGGAVQNIHEHKLSHKTRYVAATIDVMAGDADSLASDARL
jgi:hypothetical protein